MDQKEVKFDVRLDKDAAKEYQKIKQPDLDIVDKSIDELMFRADEVGKPLGNKRGMNLAGCKEIKLRDAGIRIVFRVTNETVEVLRVVYILAIEKRSRDMVFKIASARLKLVKDKQVLFQTLMESKKFVKKER